MTPFTNPHKVELLAPAGSRDALIGALSAGADAVYLGGERFGARAYADNFSTQEIIRSIGEAHVLGRKIYLTANVLTREEELPELVKFVKELDEAGLDGVIVQDFGVLSVLHEACPDLPLHASTQISVTSSDAVRLLRKLGVCRVVPARELSLEEIRTLRKEDAALSGEPIEIEAFIHGAMCYSYSGRCLMSSFLGGRSGNRGRCAGTCRLPYRILDEKKKAVGPDARKKEVYPLSMKDMCVLSILPELIDAGIDSFKIEGRMKKPVYAAGVTAIYRKYIDRCYAWMEAGRPTPWKVEEEDLDRLRSLYIRTDLGTGYYHAKNGRNLVTIGKPGYAGTDAVLEEEIRRQYLGKLPSQKIRGRAVFRIGEPARLTVTFSAHRECSAQVTGAPVQTASGRPMTREALEARLCKTGDSLFTFSSLEIEADDNIFLPVSAVNTLRREALSKLQEEILRDAAARRSRKAAGQQEKQPEKELQKEQPQLQKEELQHEETLLKGTQPEVGLQKEQPQPEEPEQENLSGKSVKTDRPSEKKELWALVSTPAQMDAAMRSGCSCILVDGDFDPSAASAVNMSAQKTQKGNNSAVQWEKQERNVRGKVQFVRVLPPVFRVNNRKRIKDEILGAAEKGYAGILVRTLEELSLVLQTGYEGEIIADASLYSWNGRSLSALAKKCGRMVCPLELNQSAIRDAVLAADAILAGEAGADPCAEKDAAPFAGTAVTSAGETGTLMDRMVLPVYGRIPMMESAGCVRKTEKLCSGTDGFWYLEDRRGMQLPVRCRCGICSNTIYNAIPLSLHQFAGRGLYREAPVHLCMFTTEDEEQTRRILQFFGGLLTAGGPGASKRGGAAKKNARPPFEQFTNGHYKTGAL